jgi:hypothetical protein
MPFRVSRWVNDGNGGEAKNEFLTQVDLQQQRKYTRRRHEKKKKNLVVKCPKDTSTQHPAHFIYNTKHREK